MKPIVLAASLTLALLVTGSVTPPAITSGFNINRNPMDHQWKTVDSLKNEGLPQDALKIVEMLLQKARQHKNQPEIIRALLYKIALRSEFEENHLQLAIKEIDNEIAQADMPSLSILHSMQGELYFRFFNQNRYILLERTPGTGDVGNDINAWDARKVLRKAAYHYGLSLKDADDLKKTPVDDFSGIIEAGTKNAKKYRPTLFDLLAHRALDFYMQDEPFPTSALKPFQFDKPEFFGDARTFANLSPETNNAESFLFQATSILQQLAGFHLHRSDPSPLVDVELKRLSFVRQYSVIETKDSLYMASLKKLEMTYPEHPVAIDITCALAIELERLGNTYDPRQNTSVRYFLRDARDKLQQVINRFPDDSAANNCRIILNRLMQPSLNVESEYAVLPGKDFKALITYKNINQVFLRVVKITPEEQRQLTGRHLSPDEQVRYYANQPPLKKWSQVVPDENDLQTHRVEIPINELPTGYYALLVSSAEIFPDKHADKNKVSENFIAGYQTFWVTTLAFLQRSLNEGGAEFLVLHRETGKPLSGVQVVIYERKYNPAINQELLTKIQTHQTGKDGIVRIAPPENPRIYTNYIVEFNTAGERFISENYFHRYRPEKEPKKFRTQIFLFTDRSLYRPGQVVYFKGIAVETDGERHRILRNHKTEIALHNANYEKISQQQATTNDYGSFSGSFVLPVGGLMGNFQLVTHAGSVSFGVEEYKLPRFEVLFDTVKDYYKLGETMTINGIARAFAGNAVMNAEVAYRVTRRAYFPFRYFYKYIPDAGNEAEVLFGTLKTDDQGRFSIRFNAIPDKLLPPESNPIFQFSVEARVTDIHGETQMGTTSINVSNKALILSLAGGETIQREKFIGFDIEATNIGGQPIAADGQISVSLLKSPVAPLRERYWNVPDYYVMDESTHRKKFPADVYADELNRENWEVQKIVYNGNFHAEPGKRSHPVSIEDWEPGVYRIELAATDVFGEKVTFRKHMVLYSSKRPKLPLTTFWWTEMPEKTFQPGQVAEIFIGSSSQISVLMEIESKGKIVEKKRIAIKNRLQRISIPVKDSYKGGFSVRFSAIALNRVYLEQLDIEVPENDKKLEIKLETRRNQFEPGSSETFNLLITNDQGVPERAELLATLYDASLDGLRPHAWYLQLPVFVPRFPGWSGQAAVGTKQAIWLHIGVAQEIPPYIRKYYRLNWFGFNDFSFISEPFWGGRHPMKMMAMMDQSQELRTEAESFAKSEPVNGIAMQSAEQGTPTKPVATIRRDFRETAFFEPQLVTDENGNIRILFTFPESFTRWKLMALAHTADLKTGNLINEFETAREVMIVSNTPRFFRQGDQVYYHAKVVNTTANPISVRATLELSDPITMQAIGGLLLDEASKTLNIAAHGVKEVKWLLSLPPDAPNVILFRTQAIAGSHSDGEELLIPVLSNKTLVTESLPMFINAGDTKEYRMDRLASGNYKSGMQPHKLTLEFTTNPVWFAIQALPALTQENVKNPEGLFQTIFANSVAIHIVNSYPQIERVFRLWQLTQPDAYLSKLQKNQDLKSIVIEETPWLSDARNEAENKRRIAQLFERNSIQHQNQKAVGELLQMQLANGGWPWMEGMPDNIYITGQLIAGFGRLRHLGAFDWKKNAELRNALEKAIYYLDSKMDEEFKKQENKPGVIYLHPQAIHYLWARTYFLNDFVLRVQHKPMFEFWKNQAMQYWQKQPLYMQGLISIILKRLESDSRATQIINSLRNKALINDEMGMYWRDLQPGYHWYQAPVEAQALFIEAFSEVADDKASVNKMQQWLLKQKQTQAWKTDRATAEAIYALLLRGDPVLSENKDFTIFMGGKRVDMNGNETLRTEAGSGYFRLSWNKDQITPAMATIRIENKGKTIGWGGLYWQYFDDMENVTSYQTPLSITRKLMKAANTPEGVVLQEVSEESPLVVGDKMVMRIELRADRTMEYIHMKDLRAPAFEPINPISQYRYQGGLSFYESPRDAATHFFIQFLPKGTYVFEYPVHVTQAGTFSSGITTIQCLYAPEFSSHSEGIRIRVIKP